MRQFSFVSSAGVSSRKAFLVTSDGTFFLISKTSGTPMKNITTASDSRYVVIVRNLFFNLLSIPIKVFAITHFANVMAFIKNKAVSTD